MDITLLYELRNRLRTAMIAGTNLLSEDFRLKRAVENIQPLEKVAPVFAKIGELSRNLIALEQTDKVDMLLQVITLLDAVLCTQGAVSVSGEVEEIEGNHIGTAITNAPYSVVKGLLDALTSSGSGHYSYVLNTHQMNPELFADYRVKSAMVQALGASYAELAQTIEDWLKEEGEEIIPLLKKDFNPKGKKEMVRRIHVIEAVAGQKENDFYVKQLAEAEKEVRQALIYALRHDSDNVELLMELTKTERGNAKKTACLALVYINDERSGEFFRKMHAKKAKDVMEYVFLSNTKWASELVAQTVKKQLLSLKEERENEGFGITNEQGCFWLTSLKALIGKSGDEILEVHRMAAEMDTRLNLPLTESAQVYSYYSDNFGPEELAIMSYPIVETYNKTSGYTKGNRKTTRHSELLLSHALPYYMQLSLLVNPDKELLQLAVELYENGVAKNRRTKYFPAALTAKLLLGEDCSDWLREELKIKENNLYRGLVRLSYDSKKKQYVLRTTIYNPADSEKHCYKNPIGKKLSGKLIDILTTCKKANIETVLCNCVNPEDREGCEKLENYFYQKVLKEKNAVLFGSYCRALKACKCSRCEGILQNYLINKKNAQQWELMSIISDIPGTNEEKLDEMVKTLELIYEGKAKVIHWNEEQYIKKMEEFR